MNHEKSSFSRSRRQWIGHALVAAGLTRAASRPAGAQSRRRGGNIIDTHIHLWKLQRSAPPMSDFANFPAGRNMPWLEVDRLIPDYDATVGGRKVGKVVLIESSVGVTPERILQSNRWMLETAAVQPKILSVIGNLDVSQAASGFAEQTEQLSRNKQWIGIRIGGGIFQAGAPRGFSSIKPNVLENLAFLAKRRLQIDALGIPGAILSQVGTAVSGLAIVMDHIAGKPTTFDIEEAWKADMQAAAAYPGLNIKLSDTHKLSSQAVLGQRSGAMQFQPIADPSRYFPVLEFLTKTFGDRRLIFGTNWPVSDAAGLNVDSIDLQIGIIEEFLAQQPAGARDRVMYENAARVYGPRKQKL